MISPPAPGPLHGAERDQLVRGVRESGCRRAREEEDDRELEDRLAAEQVAGLAVDGHHDGHRQ
jgi:hypothetical protein